MVEVLIVVVDHHHRRSSSSRLAHHRRRATMLIVRPSSDKAHVVQRRRPTETLHRLPYSSDDSVTGAVPSPWLAVGSPQRGGEAAAGRQRPPRRRWRRSGLELISLPRDPWRSPASPGWRRGHARRLTATGGTRAGHASRRAGRRRRLVRALAALHLIRAKPTNTHSLRTALWDWRSGRRRRAAAAWYSTASRRRPAAAPDRHRRATDAAIACDEPLARAARPPARQRALVAAGRGRPVPR